MKVEASLKYYRRSPKKVLETAGLIKGTRAVDAVLQLENLRKGDSDEFVKLIRSAIANAENNFNLDKDNLLIEEIRIQKGPVIKRWRARAYGRAAQILKRTCHLTIVLNEIEEGKKMIKTDKKAKTEKEEKNEENEDKNEAGGEKTKDNKIDKKEKFLKDGEKKAPKSDWSKKIFRRKSV